jgi:rhamnosyltransferase
VIQIPPESFSHGGTRNLLMERAQGEFVAFLTQDAVPADDCWLRRLLDGFGLTDDVGLAFGPYRARADASPMVARELEAWFASFSPGGGPRIDRLAASERGLPARALLGPRGFFTDANGCVARAAWERVPFRPVRYAEDHVLAHDMLRAGFAKVFMPDAAVIHSHDYSSWNWLRRSFDEARAMAEVYGYAEPFDLRRSFLNVWGLVGADWRWSGEQSLRGSPTLLFRSAAHHAVCSLGALLGAHARRLPSGLSRQISLERRPR